jgi:hypothetical protein
MDLIEYSLNSVSEKRHPWELARYYIIENQVNNLFNEYNFSNTVLIDIGCGDAFVINKLEQKFNFNTSIAVDINFTKEIVNFLKKSNNKILYLNSLDQLIIDEKKSYIIILNDVIEHVEDHLSFISDINEKIIKKVENLSFYITVPAHQKLFGQHDIDLGHYRRYKVFDLIQYNEILKLKIIDYGYFFTLLFYIRIIEKILQKKNTNVGVSNWNKNNFITNILTSILIFDYKIGNFLNKIGIKIYGLSTYIIFKKVK